MVPSGAISAVRTSIFLSLCCVCDVTSSASHVITGLILLFYVPWLNLIAYFFEIELSAQHIIISLLSIIFIFSSTLLSSKSFSMSIFSSFLYPFAMLVLLFSGYRSFLSSFDGDIKWKGRSTPSVGIRKLYNLIFFPFTFLNWFYKKIRS